MLFGHAFFCPTKPSGEDIKELGLMVDLWKTIMAEEREFLKEISIAFEEIIELEV